MQLQETPETPTRQLNPQERALAQYLVAGNTLAESARLAGYNVANDNSAAVLAHEIKSRPAVAAYLKELKEAQHIANALSTAERRDILAQIARSTISNISENSVAANISYDKEGNAKLAPPKTTDKIAAIKLDAELTGELSGAQISIDNRKISLVRLDDSASIAE